MELEIIQKITEYLSLGGTGAVVFLLVCIIAYLLNERRKQQLILEKIYESLIEAKDNQNKASVQLLEKQHSVTLSMIDVMNEIKIVLTTIKDTL